MSSCTRSFLALVRKDLRVFRSDRRALILSFVAPLALASIFASLGGGGGEGSKVSILVLDQDCGPIAKEIVAGMREDEGVSLREALDEAAARESVRQGQVGVAVVIPKGFGDRAAKGMFNPSQKAELTFLTDPTRAAEAAMVHGLLMKHAMKAISRDAFGGPGGQAAIDDAMANLDSNPGMPDALREALRSMFDEVKKVQRETGAVGAMATTDFSFGTPFEVKSEVVKAGQQLDRSVMAAHSFAGMAVQFILFAAIESGIGLLTERQKGLWRRVRAAPLSRWVLLGSKAASQAIIAVAIIGVLYLFGATFFGVKLLGSWLGFGLVAIGYSLAAATFGLLIAAIGKTPQAARGVSVLAVLLMVLLGGAWLPMFLFPEWLQTATLAIPTRWAVDGLEGATWRGSNLLALAPKAAALVGFAALFGTLAALRFRWEEE